MKRILGGEVFWNWTLVDMANEGNVTHELQFAEHW